MNDGDPSTSPLEVILVSSCRVAIPKSLSLARPSDVTMMLAGFTSRWTIPLA